MINALLGSKLKMSHSFEDSKRIPVTLIKVGPCVVTDIKTNTKHGYMAVQLGYDEKKLKNTTKSLQGHLKTVTSEKKAPRYLREIRLTEEATLKVGDKLNLADVFSVGDTVSLTSTSKGKGFAGGVKRWHFKGGPKTHGQSDRLRAPGSIGQGTTPGRVYKGKHMAGRMGGDTVTVRNLKVVSIDTEASMLAVSGPVPGTTGSLVIVKKIKGGTNE